MLKNQHWIKADFAASGNGICPFFRKEFEPAQKPEKALLEITGKGVYYAEIDGQARRRFYLSAGLDDLTKTFAGADIRCDGVYPKRQKHA